MTALSQEEELAGPWSVRDRFCRLSPKTGFAEVVLDFVESVVRSFAAWIALAERAGIVAGGKGNG